MNITKQVIILSAEHNTNTPEGNRQRTETLKGCLQDCGIAFSEGTGVYNNGPEEASLVAVINNETDFQTVRDFAFKTFDQDAIIHQDANQEAYLIEKTGETTRLGRLQQVSKEVAFDKGNFTFVNGQYFTTIPRT